MKRAMKCSVIAAFAMLWSTLAGADNYVEVFTARSDNPSNPTQAFVAEVEIELADLTDVTAVSVMAGSTPLTLEEIGDGRWSAEVEYTNLDALRTGLDGTWTITITATPSSTSTFAFSALSLSDADYFATPTGLNPAHGAIDVPANQSFSWIDPATDPTNPPYVFGAAVGSETGGAEQEGLSAPFGSLAPGATTFDPPLSLGPGLHFFEVFYIKVDSSLVTPLVVTTGTITWGNSPFAPTAMPFGPWPASTPLTVLDAFTEFAFTTAPLLEDFDAYPLQIDDVGSGGEFFVTSGGNPSDPVVASVTDALAGSTSIGVDVNTPLDRVWQLGAMSGSTGSSDGTQGFLLIGDIPGFSLSTTGPLADFFSSPRQLFNHSLRARVREPVGLVPTQFRFLVGDASDNEAASPLMPLTTTLTSYEASLFEFADFGSNSGPTDFSQIVGLGIEFFTDPATATTTLVPFLFEVDDLEIVAAPEPSSTLLGLTGLAVLALLARRARTGERSRRGLPRGSR